MTATGTMFDTPRPSGLGDFGALERRREISRTFGRSDSAVATMTPPPSFRPNTDADAMQPGRITDKNSSVLQYALNDPNPSSFVRELRDTGPQVRDRLFSFEVWSLIEEHKENQVWLRHANGYILIACRQLMGLDPVKDRVQIDKINEELRCNLIAAALQSHGQEIEVGHPSGHGS